MLWLNWYLLRKIDFSVLSCCDSLTASEKDFSVTVAEPEIIIRDK